MMNCSRKDPPLPFLRGEWIEVRGSPATRSSKLNPHLALSFAKGEAKNSNCKLRG